LKEDGTLSAVAFRTAHASNIHAVADYGAGMLNVSRSLGGPLRLIRITR